MLLLRKEWRSPHALLSLLLLSSRLLVKAQDEYDSIDGGEEVETDLLLAARPRPSNVGISLDEFQGLLFTHVDNEVGRPDGEDGGLNRAFGAELMWTSLVEHGWQMATMAEQSVQERDAISALSNSIETDAIRNDGSTEKTSSFLVCARGGQMSGYERLKPVLAEFGADASDTLVVSNQQDETCRFVTTTASKALSVSGKVVDSLFLAIVPVFDMMKISLGSIDEVSSERWSIPPPSPHSRALSVLQNDTWSKDEISSEWDRAIMVGLAPGVGGNSDEECEGTAAKILSDVRSMAEEGRLRRRRLREKAPNGNLRRAKQVEDDEHQAHHTPSISISDAFSATSMLADSPSRRRLRSSTKKIWSRALERGLESNHMCATMLNEMDVRLRYGNKGFEFVLNPFHKADRSLSSSYNVEASASNTDCVVSFIAALSTHPHVVTVESNGEITSDSNTNAQWITQSAESNSRPFFDADITGAGEVVSVSDSGVDVGSCFFQDLKGNGGIFNGNWDFSRRKVISYDNTFRDDKDQRGGHGSHVAGTMVGDRSDGKSSAGRGIAPDAKLHVFDMKPGDGGMSDPGAKRLFKSLYNNGNGAKVHNGSWGRSGRPYSSHCQDWDGALSGDYDEVLYVVSAGNTGGGQSTVKNPADCKNVLTVGCSQSDRKDLSSNSDKGIDYMVHWSSRGPTHDKRTKPDVVAPGYYLSSAYGDPNKSGHCSMHKMAGTSMSAPAVAGNAALVRQYFRDGFYPYGKKGSGESLVISGSLVKAVLVNGAQFLKGVQRVPGGYAPPVQQYDNTQNMGRVDLSASVSLDGVNDISTYVVDDKVIADGDVDSLYVDIKNNGCSTSEMSVSLVWYDPPTAAYCTNCIRNNLDLLIEKVNGGTTTRTYYPNGLSRPDTKNTVERIRLDTSHGESYRVSVMAQNFEDASQKYSIALTGCFEEGSIGVPKTSSPTASPSELPSLEPSGTSNLTASLSELPSLEPSSVRSESPSAAPSSDPSFEPSLQPSSGPSSSLSSLPSLNPTISPSYAPSSSPTIAPSKLPTAAPSTHPSASPTIYHSVAPSNTHSASPSNSASPTVSHSTAPSNTHSASPSNSASPTVSHSTAPSKIHSANPSNSASPTVSHSTAPSNMHSANPSNSPFPSSTASVMPSTRSSALPSSSPTLEKSAEPSEEPTQPPTLSPTNTTEMLRLVVEGRTNEDPVIKKKNKTNNIAK